MEKYKLHLEALQTEIKVGKMVRVDLMNGMYLHKVKELSGFKYEIKDGYKHGDLEVVYLVITGYKASAKIEFTTDVYEDCFGDKDKRWLSAIVTVNGENSEDVFEELAKLMESELYGEFARCPDSGDNYYCDCMSFEYEHGAMTELKKDIKDSFKNAKKQLGIR